MIIKEKSIEERMDEMRRLYKQLSDLGLSKEHNGIRDFMQIANDFVKDGQSASGKISLDGLKRDLIYTLSLRKQIPSSITLKFNKDR